MTAEMLSKVRRWGTRTLTLVAGIYVIFIVGWAWRAYAKATAPHEAVSLLQVGSAAPAPATPQAGAAAVQRSLDAQAAKLDSDEKELARQQQYFESRAKDLDKRGDDLERLIAELTIGSSAYTLLLGLFAFFGLKGAASEADRYLNTLKEDVKSFKTTADEDLKETRTVTKKERAARKRQFARFRRELKDDIPSLVGMQRALNLLLERIRREVDLSKIWTLGDPYNDMSEEQRQRVIMAEMTVAAFDYFRLDSSQVQRNVAAQIFANLGNFYSARARKDANRYDPSDIHRARLYIDRAHLMSPTDSRILAQRAAFVLSNTAKKGDRPTAAQLDEAGLDLAECLRLDPSNIRGLYNLAWIADERKQLLEAVDYLSRIISLRDSLPATERGRRMISAFINRACARAKIRASLANPPELQELDAKITQDCQEAWKEGKLFDAEDYARRSLGRELGPGGELEQWQTRPR